MAEFNNNRVLFGFINGHGVLLEKLLKAPPSPPIYGYALTQEDYEELIPETDLYYAIYDDAPNQAIFQVVHCSQAEYDIMQKWERALYLIESGEEIVDVRYGIIQVKKLYQNNELIYKYSPYPNWFPEEPVPSPSIWYNYAYYAILGVYRWGTTPALYRYSSPTNRAVTITANSSNQLIGSGFDSNDSKFEIAYLRDTGWYINSGYWNANRTEANCPKIFLYDTNFSNITLNGIPKE